MEAEEENGKDLFKYINGRNTIWKHLKSLKIVDVSKLYEKTVFTLNINTGSDSLLIELGEYKWTFTVCRMGTSLRFKLFADKDKSNFYALDTLAIIHPLDYQLTYSSDRFHLFDEFHPSDVFDVERAFEKGFLDAEGNVKVELQIQVFGENVFLPLLVKKYRAEIFLTYTHLVDDRCSRFIEFTQKKIEEPDSR